MDRFPLQQQLAISPLELERDLEILLDELKAYRNGSNLLTRRPARDNGGDDAA